MILSGSCGPEWSRVVLDSLVHSEDSADPPGWLPLFKVSAPTQHPSPQLDASPGQVRVTASLLPLAVIHINVSLKCPLWASLEAQLVKNLPAMQETLVRFLGWEDPLKKGQATHSSILGLPLWLTW